MRSTKTRPRTRSTKTTWSVFVSSRLRGLLVCRWFGCGHAQAAPRQAVVETSAGTFIIDLDARSGAESGRVFHRSSPQDGAYDGTTFHRVVKYGMVQGGDPISKDPAKRSLYGTGGLNAVKAEARAAKMTRGSVAAVLVPGRPDSAGAQFFVVLADQPALDGQYTVFGQVSDGMEVLQKISETPVDAAGLATDRVEIRRVTIRDDAGGAVRDRGCRRSWPATGRCSTPAWARSRSSSFPTRRPNTSASSCGWRDAGVYDGMAFHRVAPGFVIQTGALNTRDRAAHRDGSRSSCGTCSRSSTTRST